MRVAILAPGSRGDVQPYLAIGQALRTLGHDCRLVTTLDHGALVRAHGLEVALLPVNVAEELGQAEALRTVEGGGVLASFRSFAAIAQRAARLTVEVGLEAAREADVLVTNFGTALVAEALGRKLGLPVVQAFNVPITTTGAFPGALFPWLDLGAPARRLGHRLTRALVWSTARASARAACREQLGTDTFPRWPGAHPGLVPGPVLYGFSEAFLPRPADWSAEVEVTGFWFAAEPVDFAPPAELVRFLAEGPPPVCVGFGSMGTERPEEVSACVLEAARRARVRLVLLSGWAGLAPGRHAPEVLALQGIPHSWLHPRCRAVVHHGGAGTTAAAMRAGVPAVVVPFHGDQPFWAARVARLGLGPAPIPRRKLSAKRLADALARATGDERMRRRAEELGRLVRAEEGAARAARAILARAATARAS